ncbi:MAG TPA: hypothetical protein VGN57_22415 [Pirellulaceae bacterium]|jgi:hypothetical protein|nr:hypothetical protein [Pirellulaceae bacterium]
MDNRRFVPAASANGRRRLRSARRSGAMLAEAMIALTIAVAASSIILLAIEESVSRTLVEEDRQLARDMADLLFAEMELLSWNDPSATADEWPLGPEAGEIAGHSRANFDDLGDYNGMAPPRLCGRYGKTIGVGNHAGANRPAELQMNSGAAERIKFTVEVRYVSEFNFWDSAASPTNVRHVLVSVQHRVAPYTEIDRFHRWFVKPLPH